MSLRRTLAAVALGVAFVAGCRDPQSGHVESKCDANNPYICADGHACCTSWEPICKGPDSEGYYCEPEWSDPDDPTHQFGARKRVRAVPRSDK